jgi:hypothetical protein
VPQATRLGPEVCQCGGHLLEGRLAERSGAVFRLTGLTQRLEDETVAVGDSDGLAELTSLIEGPGEPGPSCQRMREISEWWEVSCEDCSALRGSSRGIGSGGGTSGLRRNSLTFRRREPSLIQPLFVEFRSRTCTSRGFLAECFDPFHEDGNFRILQAKFLGQNLMCSFRI